MKLAQKIELLRLLEKEIEEEREKVQRELKDDQEEGVLAIVGIRGNEMIINIWRNDQVISKITYNDIEEIGYSPFQEKKSFNDYLIKLQKKLNYKRAENGF